MTETSSHDHHHHHHAPHPYAEPSSPRPLLPSTPEEEDDGSAKKEEDEEEAELATLPSRLDRLIAFLDSYFGSVELLKSSAKTAPTEAATETSAPATSAQSAAGPTGAPEKEAVAQIDASEPAEKSEQEAVKIEAAAAEERANEIERERKHPRAPVIRVKLDEHFADVNIESLVRFFSFEPDGSQGEADDVPAMPGGRFGLCPSSTASRIGCTDRDGDRDSPREYRRPRGREEGWIVVARAPRQEGQGGRGVTN